MAKLIRKNYKTLCGKEAEAESKIRARRMSHVSFSPQMAVGILCLLLLSLNVSKTLVRLFLVKERNKFR